jgi:hypothetical protein
MTRHDAEYSLLEEIGEAHVLHPRLSVRVRLGCGSQLMPPQPPLPANRDEPGPVQLSTAWSEVPLKADGEFFSDLQTDLSRLDLLQCAEQESMYAACIY